MPEPTLTSLSRGGGCGCKIDPGRLRELLDTEGELELEGFERLVVGNATADDCAAWQLDGERLIVSTTDFFMPIVDDPHDFGRIAAANALSDVYAMGATPIFALAIVGMPVDALGSDTIRRILAGGRTSCSAAGVPVAGGHSIDSSEPIYGLAVTGVCAADRLVRNDTARAGDALVLGKPLGIGILSAALRKGELGEGGYSELIAGTTQLNRAGEALAERGLATAMTDTTGFGLLGHSLEMCRGSGLSARIDFASLPIWPSAARLAEGGIATGASGRNWRSCREEVELDGIADWQRALLTDPQTNGGLLVACRERDADAALEILRESGCEQASRIGSFEQGPSPKVLVQAGG